MWSRVQLEGKTEGEITNGNEKCLSVCKDGQIFNKYRKILTYTERGGLDELHN